MKEHSSFEINFTIIYSIVFYAGATGDHHITLLYKYLNYIHQKSSQYNCFATLLVLLRTQDLL